MSSQRIAFTTDELMVEKPLYPGQKPVFSGEVDVLGPTRIERWSTGRLEQAVASGMEPFVCSTRPSLDAHDRWWRAMVAPENIFLFVELNQGTVHVTEIRWKFCLPWQRLFQRLDLRWEPSCRSVDEARAELARQGVLKGTSFSPIMGSG
jgi:hypothetical protein